MPSVPKNCVYRGENNLSKCAICERKIPKGIFRNTFSHYYFRFRKNHNTCASCLIEMVKGITKQRGQKKAIKEWDRLRLLKMIVGDEE